MTKERKVRQDSWTKAEDDVLIKIIYRFMREGRTQIEAFEYAAHRTGRTGAACGFRWNKELRGDAGTHAEFIRNRNIGRLHNKKVKSVRTDQWAEDWKDRDRYSQDALKEAYDGVYKSTVSGDEPTPLATAFIESLAKVKPTLEKTPMQEINAVSNVGRYEDTTPRGVVQGVGPDAPTTYNKSGGAQSASPYRLDLIDPKALLATAKVLKEGAEKYGDNNWKLIDVDSHLNHLLVHVYAHLAGDKSDEHLSHAVCRALFALGVQLEEEE